MPIANRTSLVEDVYRELALQLVELARAGQEWLPNTQQLATRFGVSRTVVREAVNRLELQGLVEVRHGVGLRIVKHLSKPMTASVALLLPDVADRLRQAMEARLLIEVEIARLAAKRITDAAIAELQQAQQRLGNPAITNEEAIAADFAFHAVIARSCGNNVLELMLESITALARESRMLTIARTGAERAFLTHQGIVKAMTNHDPAAAATAMRQHLEITRSDLEAQLSEQAADDAT